MLRGGLAAAGKPKSGFRSVVKTESEPGFVMGLRIVFQLE
jgi:hypothetical protein